MQTIIVKLPPPKEWIKPPVHEIYPHIYTPDITYAEDR